MRDAMGTPRIADAPLLGEVRRTAVSGTALVGRLTAFVCLFAAIDGSVELERAEAATIIGLIAVACFSARGQWLGAAIAGFLGRRRT